MATRARKGTRRYSKKAQSIVASAMRRKKRGTLKSGRCFPDRHATRRWHTSCSHEHGSPRDAGGGKMDRRNESGRIGYLVLYMMGVPIGILLLLWVLLGNNIFGPG